MLLENAAVKSFAERNGLSLAYLGDAVIELLARETALKSGTDDVGKLNTQVRDYVTAKAQSAAIERLLPILTEEETDFFRRGRNAHGLCAPKSASVGEYRRATGMEALFGYLYLTDQTDRMAQLFEIAYREDPV